MAKFYYDDSNLQKLWKELNPERRRQALKGAFRREANRVRRVAIGNLRDSIRSDSDLERGVRAIVFRRTAGFRVTVGTKAANKKTANKKTDKGERGSPTNRRDLKKHVPLWAELGTNRRYTKSKTRVFKRSRKGHYTGRMKRYGFMATTRQQVAGSVTENLHREVVDNIKRISKKYGCT